MSIVSDFKATAERLRKPNDRVERQCPICRDGDGFVCYTTRGGLLHFRECSGCFNPKGRRSP